MQAERHQHPHRAFATHRDSLSAAALTPSPPFEPIAPLTSLWAKRY